MHYSQSPPLAEKEWLTAGARDLDAVSDQRIGIRAVKPSIHSPRSSSLKGDQVASDRPSVGRRIFRTLTRFFIAVLIGVGGTLAWQSHGDAAREMVIARAPTLAWLLSVSTTKSPAVAATSPDPVQQQLEPLASNLDRQKMSSTPPSPSQQAASMPQPKPPQPRAQSSAVQSSSLPRPPPPAGPLVLSR